MVSVLGRDGVENQRGSLWVFRNWRTLSGQEDPVENLFLSKQIEIQSHATGTEQ